jgi:hypothetical protein
VPLVDSPYQKCQESIFLTTTPAGNAAKRLFGSPKRVTTRVKHVPHLPTNRELLQAWLQHSILVLAVGMEEARDEAHPLSSLLVFSSTASTVTAVHTISAAASD